MSVKIMAQVFALGEEVQAADRLLLLAIADAANTDGVAWPGVRTLAKMCGMSEATARRHLKDLVDAGLLQVETQERANGGQTANLYRLLLNGPQAKKSAKKGQGIPPSQNDTPPLNLTGGGLHSPDRGAPVTAMTGAVLEPTSSEPTTEPPPAPAPPAATIMAGVHLRVQVPRMVVDFFKHPKHSNSEQRFARFLADQPPENDKALESALKELALSADPFKVSDLLCYFAKDLSGKPAILTRHLKRAQDGEALSAEVQDLAEQRRRRRNVALHDCLAACAQAYGEDGDGRVQRFKEALGDELANLDPGFTIYDDRPTGAVPRRFEDWLADQGEALTVAAGAGGEHA